jgi:ATP-dependent exoDNAse (exonuclease V) beta subunit
MTRAQNQCSINLVARRRRQRWAVASSRLHGGRLNDRIAAAHRQSSASTADCLPAERHAAGKESVLPVALNSEKWPPTSESLASRSAAAGRSSVNRVGRLARAADGRKPQNDKLEI